MSLEPEGSRPEAGPSLLGQPSAADQPVTRSTSIAMTAPVGGVVLYGASRYTDPPEVGPVLFVAIHDELDRWVGSDVLEPLDRALPLGLVVDGPEGDELVAISGDREHERHGMRTPVRSDGGQPAHPGLPDPRDGLVSSHRA